MSNHTPTPWHIESVAVGAFKSVVSLVSGTDGKVTNITCSDADAAFIVRAVNAHDAMVEAATWAIAVISNPDAQETVNKLRAALKLALGEA